MYVSEDFAHQVLLANYGNSCQKIFFPRTISSSSTNPIVFIVALVTMYCGFEFELLNINEIVGFG